MRKIILTYIPSATRLSLRRVARAFSYPGGQVGLTSSLAVYSLLLKVPLFIVLVWISIILTISIVQDLAEPHSRLMAFLHWLKGTNPRQSQLDLREQYRIYSIHPLPPLFRHRAFCRLILPFFTLLVIWIYAIGLQRAWLNLNREEIPILSHLLLVSGIVPFAVTCVTRLDGVAWRKKYLFWLATMTLGCTAYLVCFWPASRTVPDLFKVGSGLLFYLTLYGTVFIFQRLSSGERVLNEVIRDLSLHFLEYEDMTHLRKVPDIIGQKLRHERVYILEPGEKRDSLFVTASYSNFTAASGATIPITQSLTGKAFTEQKIIVWNDVRACPYYHGLPGDSTRAEIAVPVIYRGTVHAILDVQSTTEGVYGPGDVDALETVAQILGTAIGANRRDALFRQAVELWEQLAATTNMAFSSEVELVEIFAEFAEKHFQTDVITYFSLAITGCPIHKPDVYGHLYYPDLIMPPHNDPSSWLVQLITAWEPFYEEDAEHITPDVSSNAVSFIRRERVVSTCFIPVGTQQERLAGIFLNFRQPKQFDLLFRFTVLGLTQSLARAVAQIRYRDIVYQGFGRPELGLHNIIGRHGLKTGVVSQAAAIRQRCSTPCCLMDDPTCGLHSLLRQMDTFLEELKLVESARPPLVWRESLKRKLDEYISSLPPQADGPRPTVHLQVDATLEKESSWMKLALFRLTTEAIANAIFHGAAAFLNVEIKRTPSTIEVLVQNDGLPIPDTAAQHKSSYGIFALLNEFQNSLGATTQIVQGHEGIGTIVSSTIPVLPLTAFAQEIHL